MRFLLAVVACIALLSCSCVGESNQQNHQHVSKPKSLEETAKKSLSVNKKIGTTPVSELVKQNTPEKQEEQHGDLSQVSVPSTSGLSHHHAKMTFTNLVVNIVADLCPHGMLPLAYGLAQGGPTGLVPSGFLILLFGLMSAYSMTLYASLAKETGAQSIGMIWGELINLKTEWLIDLSIFALCFGCCVFYSAFIGDIFNALSRAAGLKEGMLSTRWATLLGITTVVLLPLCLLEDLSALKFSSLLGVAGIIYTFGFHIYRMKDGSYAADGSMLQYVSSKYAPRWPEPKFTTWKINTGTLMLANMLCVAFLAHYNAINYYGELENANASRYRSAIAAGFGIALTVFAGMMIVGYSLFGSAAQPLILNNFAKTEDSLATLARLATGLAIVFAYPLMFAGLKSSMFEILVNKDKADRIKGRKDLFTELVKKLSGIFRRSQEPVNLTKKQEEMKKLRGKVAIILVLALITGIGIVCGEEDVSTVLGIVGSVLGCFVAYMLPGILGLANMKRRKLNNLTNSKLDVIVQHMIILLGGVFGVLGVWTTLTAQPHH